MPIVFAMRVTVRLFSLLALFTLILSAALPGSSAAAPSTAPFPGGPLTKLLVDSTDTSTLYQLAASGAHLLADYGAFALWGLPTDALGRFAARPSVSLRPDFDRIGLRAGAIDTRSGPADVPVSLRQARIVASQLWLVQFLGPIQDRWLAGLTRLGLTPVIYMPQNAYLVWGSGAALQALETQAASDPTIQWTGPYHPAYRLAPELQQTASTRPAEELVDVTVQLYTTKALEGSLKRLLNLGGQIYQAPARSLVFTNVSLQVPAGQLVNVAQWADVYNVEPWVAPQRLDEAQGQILAGNLTTSGANVVPSGPGYLAWLASKGFPTTPSSYPVVDIVDDGIDNGTTNPLHPDFHEQGVAGNPSRLIYNSTCTADASGNGVGGHGNLNAGIVGSYNNLNGSPHQDVWGYRLGLGMAPYGRLAGTKIFDNEGSYNVSACANSHQGVVANSYNRGAHLTSNSWGASVFGAYDASAQAYDALTRDASSTTAGNQQMLHVFSNGNRGPGANTVGTPATAKNVLAVGATENVRDEGISDACGATYSNNADDIAFFSSRGPTDDGRIKPEIMAPGVHVQGPASQDPAYNANGVCGADSADRRYYPLGQTLYTWSTGTSHSAPAVAGAASLAYEYYGRVLKPGQRPSPAMLKALLLNSPRYLNGGGTGGTLPSNNQGWGDVNLGTLVDGHSRRLYDQMATQTLGATGDTRQINGTVTSINSAFRVTLVWTDAPGPTTGNAYVNDLNLEVTVGGQTYKGNVFTGATSSAGGAFDAKNNAENVFLPAGLSGPFSVRVIGANIAGDGVPGNADVTDQDFALVIYNGTVAPTTILSVNQVTVSENNNGINDPGDTLTLVTRLENAGDLTATSVSGQLSVVSGTVTLLNATSAYPDIAEGQAMVTTTPYSLRIADEHPCGTPIVLREVLTYNGGQTLTHTMSLPVGLPLIFTGVSTDVPKAIPDNNQTGIEVNLPMTSSAMVDDVNVRLSITHTYDGDLNIQLQAPNGSVVSLAARRGANSPNYTGTIFDDEATTLISSGAAPFTGRFQPESPLSALDGTPISGTWKLLVQDHEAVDVGSVLAFALDITSQSFQCTPFNATSSFTHLPFVFNR